MLIAGKFTTTNHGDVICTESVIINSKLIHEGQVVIRSYVLRLMVIAAIYMVQVSDGVNLSYQRLSKDSMYNSIIITAISSTADIDRRRLVYLASLTSPLNYNPCCVYVRMNKFNTGYMFNVSHVISDIEHIINSIDVQVLELLPKHSDMSVSAVLRFDGPITIQSHGDYYHYDSRVLDDEITVPEKYDYDYTDVVVGVVDGRLLIHDTYGYVYDPLTYRIHMLEEDLMMLWVGCNRVITDNIGDMFHAYRTSKYGPIHVDASEGGISIDYMIQFIDMFHFILEQWNSLQVTFNPYGVAVQAKIELEEATYTEDQNKFLNYNIPIFKSRTYVQVGDVEFLSNVWFNIAEKYAYNINDGYIDVYIETPGRLTEV